MSWKVSNIRLGLDEPEEVLPDRLAARLGVGRAEIAHWRILRKSLDARRHDQIHFLYAAEVELPGESTSLGRRTPGPDVAPFVPERFDWPEPGRTPLPTRPVVIGAGPAGLLAGYFLALAGYRPLVLERGREVKDRVADVRRFDAGGAFDPESNYLFGEGGAGTFSDGKLTSRSAGPDVRKVLEVIAECHGKPSILYEQRPHLGSNRLPLIVRTLRRKLEELGGEVRFSCRVEDVEIDGGRLRALRTSSGRIAADVAVLAVGHSARDTYGMLLRRGVPLVPKPFQIGVRIEQPQGQVDVARYGQAAGHPALGAADYSLNVRAGARDLFTFCMCAGGYVMPSVSEPGYFCTNGMSESRHDSPFANSGLVVTVSPEETGSRHPLAGVHFQQRAERLAYLAGKRRYAAPIQWARDFLNGRASRGNLPSSYPRGIEPIDLGAILPPVVLETIERGLPIMDRRFGGLFLKHATLTGPESRGSSRYASLATTPPAKARPSPAFTLAARGPAMPVGSSARPSMASAPPAPWLPDTLALREGDRPPNLLTTSSTHLSRMTLRATRMVGADDAERVVVQEAVGGEEAGDGQRQGLAPGGGDAPAGFLDEQAAGGEIPGGELVFKERAEEAGADHAEVERGRAEAADAVDVLAEQVADRPQGRLHHRAPVVVEADAEEHLVQPRLLADPHALAVVEGPLAPDGGVPVLGRGVDDDPADRFPRAVVRDRDPEMRDLVQEVVRPVERVHDPEMLGLGVPLMRFLAEHVMVGKVPPDHRDDRLLGLDVGIRDEVGDVLAPHGDPFAEIRSEDRAAARAASSATVSSGRSMRGDVLSLWRDDRVKTPMIANSGRSHRASQRRGSTPSRFRTKKSRIRR